MKSYLSSTPIKVAPKPQEPLLLYLAATNQVVSDVLVAQREFEEEAAVAAKPSDDGPELSPAVPDAGKAEPPASPGPGKTGSAQMGEVEQKKKVVQHPVYFVGSLLQGLDRDTLVCRSCSSASLWPQGSCVIIFKHMRSPSSLASRCNGSCTTQMQPGGLWSGHWNCQALVSGLKALRQFKEEPWRSS